MDTITRSVPFTLERSEAGDGLTLTGYAAVFNSPTRIRGEGPDFDEVIAPGAFAKTISERTPVLMFDHGHHPLVGSIPIGQITSLREDVRGLRVEARLHDNWLTQPVRDAIATGSIDGMSFRFNVPKGKETWDRSGDVPLRTLKEVNCPELGPVVFPAYADTSVGVRSMVEALDERTRSEIVECFRELAAEPVEEPDEVAERDMTEEQEDSVVDQIKQLVVSLLQDEAGELSQDPDATGAISALLTVLADLDWYVMVDEMEDADMASDMPAMGMNSSTLHGTSDRAAALRTLFAKPPHIAEPPPDSTPQPNSIAAARLRLLKLQRN